MAEPGHHDATSQQDEAERFDRLDSSPRMDSDSAPGFGDDRRAFCTSDLERNR